MHMHKFLRLKKKNWRNHPHSRLCTGK